MESLGSLASNESVGRDTRPARVKISNAGDGAALARVHTILDLVHVTRESDEAGRGTVPLAAC